MVEVVGTAPTSVMVITKFVYRRSWQANIINIKAFERDSIKIIKITEDMSKIDRIIYKKISPFFGKILDTLFLTNFSQRGLDHYHNFHHNDYKFNKDSFCLIHVPRTGGGTLWNYFGNNNFKNIYRFEKGSLHNPVSFLCDPKEYKYITVMRDPIDRVISQHNMSLLAKSKVASFGFANWLRNDELSRNLYCQYLSGHVGEPVDEKIYEIALKNLKNFYYVINFNNYESDIKKMFEKSNLGIEASSLKFGMHPKKNSENIDDKKIIAKKYNYWDLKLYNEFLNFKKSETNYT
jgi:hypothetical protein